MINTIERTRRCRNAITALRIAGSQCYFRDDCETRFPSRFLRWPRAMYDRALSRPIELVCTGANITDEQASHIATLLTLRTLYINDTLITDRGMRMIANLDGLTTLFAQGTKLTSDAFARTKWMHQLRVIDIDNTNVDDGIWPYFGSNHFMTELGIGGSQVRDLARLSGFPSLNSLCLNCSPFTDKDFGHLGATPGLSTLYVNCTHITDSGFEPIGRLRRIRCLAAGGTEISDDALSQLSGHRLLEELIINETNVSNRGIASIADLPNLRFLCMTDTAVTDSIFDILRRMNQLQTVFIDESLSEALTESDRAGISCEIVPIPKKGP